MRQAHNDKRLSERAVVYDRSNLRYGLIDGALAARGFEVTRVETASEALQTVTEKGPDLLVIAIDRPDPLKLDLCRELRTRPETLHVPVLVAAATHSIAITSLAAGADDYLVFPLSEVDLAARAHAAVLRSRGHRDRSVITGFPGQFSIRRELNRRISAGAEFALLHVDLDHFKEFNRRYGHSRGDEAIRFLGAVLGSAIKLDEGAFAGHAWGDHFAILCRVGSGEPIARAIVSDFEIRGPRLYANDDLNRRAIPVVQRRGEPQLSPLMSVSIGVTTSRNSGVGSEGEAREIAEELRLRAKKISGSAYVIDHRRV